MKKILIVDDEPMMLKIADRALKGQYETVLASSGEEAVELFIRNKPDMVISDLKMPTISGYDLQRLIKSKVDVSVPFIFLTSDDSHESESRGRELGAADYIKKPVRPEILLERVGAVFDNKGEGAPAANESEKDKEDGIDEAILAEEKKLPEWMLHEPLLNVREGLKNCVTADVYLASIDIFLKHVSENLEILEHSFETGDIESYTIKSHGLKSTARIIGAQTLSAKALAMEKAGNDKNIDYIKREYADFIEEYKKHDRVFREKLHGEKKEPISEGELQDALMAINEFVISKDYSIVESIVESIEKHSLDDATEEKIKRIRKCIADLDWEEIPDILGNV